MACPKTRFLLDEEHVPRSYYNLLADLRTPPPPPPPLHPGTMKPIGPDDLVPLFPKALIQQEVSTERDIEIPEGSGSAAEQGGLAEEGKAARDVEDEREKEAGDD